MKLNGGHGLLIADADINQHLHVLLGQKEYPSLNVRTNFDRLRHFVRGTSQCIREDDHVIRTTPPSEGTGIIRLNSADTLLGEFALWDGNTAYVSTGEPIHEDHGTKCYHNNLVPLEILLNHLSEGDDMVVVDTMA